MHPFLKLPVELYREIFEQLVLIAGYRKALRLRLVCRFFDREITRAICATRILETVSSFYSLGVVWASRYLHYRVLADNHDTESYLVRTIRHSVKGLLSLGENISDEDKHNYTLALSKAAALHWDSYRVLHTLKMDGDDYETKEDNQSPNCHEHLLSAAALIGNTQLTRQLLQQGVSSNNRSNVFGTALYLATLHGNNDIVALLLDTGADPNAYKWTTSSFAPRPFESIEHEITNTTSYPATPFQAACYAGNKEIIGLLLQPQFNIPMSGCEYRHAIRSAIRGGHSDIVQRLIDIGDLNTMPASTIKYFWKNGLGEVCNYGVDGMIDMVLDKGAPADSEEGFHGSYLSIAAGHGFEKIVRVLLERGADPNTMGVGGTTPLTKAAKHGHLSTVRLLVDHGASLKRLRTLTVAVEAGQEDVVRFLAENGIPVCGPEQLGNGWSAKEIGQNALRGARREGYESLASLLIELGVDPTGDE